VDAARQRIVVGVDGSAGARAALAWALAEAARRGTDVEVVTAFPVDLTWADTYLLDSAHVDAIRTDTQARAEATVAEVRAEETSPADLAVQVVVVTGPPAAELVRRSAGAALLVVGSRGRGAVRSALAGSVALHCAAHARCPVVVVHPAAVPAGEPARVVVGLDGSEPARAALLMAVALAGPLGARVDAVLAYEAPNHWSDLYAVLAPGPGETREHAQARGEAIVREVLGAEPAVRGAVRVVPVEGHPGPVLRRAAEGARLLVVGSRSCNLLEGVVLGSTALHCVSQAPCPVVVVHRGQGPGAGTAAQRASATAPAG
jgi:nucleotide-binding universal stress UspA family protein